MSNKLSITVGVVGDNSENSFLGRNQYFLGKKKSILQASIYSISYPYNNKYTYACYDFPLNIEEHRVQAESYLKEKSYIILVFNDEDQNGIMNLSDNIKFVREINPEAKIIIVKNSISSSSSESDESHKIASDFAKNNDLELLEVNDEKSSNAVFKRIAEIEQETHQIKREFRYGDKTGGAVKKIKNLNDENLTLIAERIEAEIKTANPRDLYDDDTINSALKTLQYVSIINSLENVITNALLIMFIFVTFPFINSLYERNLEERGDKNLFWADAPKQAAEVAINLANEDLKHKRS